MSFYTPIAYFAYNRPAHSRRTLAALASTPEAPNTELHIFVDGPRNSEDHPKVAQVLEIARSVQGFRSVVVHESKVNQGLYRSITQGVSAVVAKAGRVVVVEDDILVSKHFLSYMNEALHAYAEQKQVGSIHAYCPPASGFPDFFFLRGGDCWGWATWADRWSLYCDDTDALIAELVAQNQLRAFLEIYGHHSLVHLIKRAKGLNQSWASNWHASLFLANRLTLHPGRSFVENIGNDGSGTHSNVTDRYSTGFSSVYTGIPVLPLVHNREAARIMRDFIDQGVEREGLAKRVRRKAIIALFIIKAIEICLRIRAKQAVYINGGKGAL